MSFVYCFIATGITQAQKAEILDAHNRLRATVANGQVPGQPGAQNMREMVWDEELAAKAQQWANQCTFEHDPSRYLSKANLNFNSLFSVLYNIFCIFFLSSFPFEMIFFSSVV